MTSAARGGESSLPQEAATAVRPPRYVVEYAGFWRRFFAFAIDVLLMLVGIGLISGITRGYWTSGLAFAFAVLYMIGGTAEGGPLGKRMLRVRVVQLDGRRPGVGRALARETVARAVSSIVLWLGYLWMLDDAQRRTWHDKIVGTIVVHERVTLTPPAWADTPPWREPVAAGSPADHGVPSTHTPNHD